MNDKIKLTFQLLGNSLELYVRKCLNTTKLADCNITNKEINEDASILNSKNNKKEHKLELEYNRDECFNEKGK